MWARASVIARHSLTGTCIILYYNVNWLDLELKDLSVDCKLVNRNIHEFALYFVTCILLNPKESLLSWTKATVSRGVLFPSLVYSITPSFG